MERVYFFCVVVSADCRGCNAFLSLDLEVVEAGDSNFRTSFGILLIVGMPLPQHPLTPFVVGVASFNVTIKRFRERLSDQRQMARLFCKSSDLRGARMQEYLNGDKGLTKVQIGKEQSGCQWVSGK